MKNVLMLLANFMRQGLVQLVTFMFMLLALTESASAGVHVFGNQAVTVQAFTKSAKRICDTITYNFHVYILTKGGPTNVIISDIWPNGLKPASAVTFSGVTSSPAATNVNASGWSVQFDTPLGAGFVASSYTLSFTSTIDPVALAGGDFKMANQAKIAVGPKSSPEYERSDDPSQPGKEDKTVLDIPVADVKKCMNDDVGGGGGTPSIANSCFSPDVKVVCGKVAGTYDIVLNAQSLNGVTPSSVSITPTNAGVTIVNPQASYPVVAGQVKITVAGATPGAVLNFDVNGFTAGGGSFEGADLCCTGTVQITIPKDLPCDIKPELEVTKSCLPAKPNDKGGFTALCQIKVKSTGAFTTPVSISETLVGSGTVNYVNATDPWACAPPSVPGNTPMNCTLPANILNPTTDTSFINVSVDFKNAGDVKEAKNCVQRVVSASQGKPGRKHCVPFVIEEKSTVDVDKKCGPASYHKYPVGPAATGIGWVANCTITVTTTGPQTGIISVADSLTGGGTVISASSPAPWSCSPSGSSAGCSANGTLLNQTSSTSVINVAVVFPSAGHVAEGLNCASVKVNGGYVKDRDCEKFPPVELGKLTVLKEAFVNGTRYTTQTFPTKVICGGNVVTTSIQDGAAPYVQTNLPIGSSCTVVEGNNIATPAGFCKAGSVAAWNVTYFPSATVSIPAGGATVVVKNELVCNPPPPNGDIQITKVCDPVTEVIGAINTYESKCHITVTTTGPQSGLINVTDSFIGIGSLGNATAPAPWTCSGTACTVNGSALNQTSSTSVIDVTVKFNKSTDALEAKNCAEITTSKDKRSCTEFDVDDKKGKLTVIKEALYNGNHITNVSFPIAVTCGGTTTNGAVQDTVPYVQGNIPLGTQCSVVEGTIPSAGICPKDQTEVWTTTYAPATPVTITAAGATVKVRNFLTCEKKRDDKFWVKKVVVNKSDKSLAGLTFQISDQCNSAQNPGYAVFVDGQSIHFKNYEAGVNCTFNEVPPATSLCGKGSKDVWSTTYSPAQTVPLTPGGLVTVTNTFTCERIGDPVDSKLYVKKVVVNNTPGSVTGLVFPIKASCTHSPTTAALDNLSDGQTKPFYVYVAGSSCTVTETSIPATNACGKGKKDVWTTTYSPSQTIALSPNGETVTVTNTVDCEDIGDPVEGNPIRVKKVVVNNTPTPINSSLQFPIKVTCVKNVNGDVLDTDATHNVSAGQTVDYLPYAAGFNCSANEGAIKTPNLCGKAQTIMTTTYSAMPVPMTPAGETITVTNTFDCEKIDEPKLTTFSVRKEATRNGQPINNVNFQINVSCGNGVAETVNLANSQVHAIGGLPSGTTCNVSEGKIGNTGLCPKGTTENWSTTYNPASASNTTSTQSSVLVTVRNLLNCEPIIIVNPKCLSPLVLNPNTNKCEPPDCPRGTSWNGKRCVEDRKVCRPPLQLNVKTNECFRPEPDCPRGTFWDGKRCRPIAKVCPPPLQLNKKTNECFRPRPNCQVGTVWNGKICKPIVVQCKRGFKRVDNECVPIRVERKCARNEVKLPNGLCVKLARCPIGEIPTPLGCIKIGRDNDGPRDTDGVDKPRRGGIQIPGL